MREESIISCLDDQLLNLSFITYLFVYFWLLWDLAAVLSLSLVAANGGYSLTAMQGLILVASFVAEHGL